MATMTPTEATGVHRSRTWRATAASGVALLVLVTIHMVAHHFVVEEVGGLRDLRAGPRLHLQPRHVRARDRCSWSSSRSTRCSVSARCSSTSDSRCGPSAWWTRGLLVLGIATVAYGVMLISVLASRA